MADFTEGRVAVYIDFDNIVISRYEQVHGRSSFKRDRAREYVVAGSAASSEPALRAAQARVDVGAVLDYASSFGTVVISRAYADWSVPVNSNYRDQLVARAVDLVQMFPTVQSMKNGADIRMSVDVVEDLFRLPEITHVVIVSGDSDFIALAQRCRRLGRYVVGIGVAGGTSKALNAACNEYKDYDGLPGVKAIDNGVNGKTDKTETAPAKKTSTAAAAPQHSAPKPAEQRAATNLLRRALELGESKDADWIASSSVKNQMLRMDPTFQESALGHKTFTDFVKSRHNIVEIREDGQLRWLRLLGDKATETG